MKTLHEVVQEFCYLGSTIQSTTLFLVPNNWKTDKESLPNQHFSQQWLKLRLHLLSGEVHVLNILFNAHDARGTIK